MPPLKWTIKRNKEVVYHGTLKAMTLFTGQAVLIEKNGTLYGEGECIDGIKVGPWRHYHGNGQVMLQVNFDEQGREHGEKCGYYPDGTLHYHMHFDHGRTVAQAQYYYEDGALMSETHYNEAGLTLWVKEYYPDGILRRWQQMNAGKLHQERFYHPDGRLWAEKG
ncbi:toxin-antitoxin system YwqK family antitoxin [Shewanella sp. NIFS-20-20]|uniref:toxin-antitoxin system YwqK family antitoxin n=1 Tax=Shewanella sp. NIFS-20-20 TaxID=2853806 RepID=UPI001C46D227|nr:hypothetical protein [Shewanella sp. NIFS-20-20]MBV7314300.1 hypothetical protein [Shewanella sp. NIFS-20-20]